MSIFSLVGKIAKAGLSAVTHGVSDKVITAVKGLAQAKSALKKTNSNQKQALVVKTTSKPPSSAGTVVERVVMQKKSKPTRSSRKKAYKQPVVKAKPAPKKKAAKVTSTTKAKRVPPKGGLDLAEMAKAWRRAGGANVMTWQQWIKSNPLKKK